jgi:5,10-methylene-tetrahydrofolate dehydrogenase/methenyl tetrahydrofolate cyclohydrolase
MAAPAPAEGATGARIDGKAAAEELHEEIKAGVAALVAAKGVTPKLAVVLVGGRKDSATYVRMKRLAAEKVGMKFELREISEDVTQEDLIATVRELNDDDAVHGLIVQLPLPAHINEREVLDMVSFEKDIDGFHPHNIGELAMKGREPAFSPCTPLACMHLLKREGVDLNGANVVVLGRSNIVGIPVAMLCLHQNATVTIVHSRTKDIPDVVRRADVIVAAVGQPLMVKKDWVKPGAVIIDVGINSVDDATRKSGYRLVGDVDFEGVSQVASKITPVPGGVGPMTVAMLLNNTLKSATKIVG